VHPCTQIKTKEQTPSDGKDARWREGRKKFPYVNIKHGFKTAFRYLHRALNFLPKNSRWEE